MAERIEFIANDHCKLKDNVKLFFGDGADDADPSVGDVALYWDGSDFHVDGANVVLAPTFNTADESFQTVEADATIGATAGSNTANDPNFLGAVMGNVFDDGAALTKVANYVGGVIGHYSVAVANASTYPTGAVLAGIGDGVSDTSVHGVVAYIDGDSAETIAGAAFKVMCNNSTATSGFHFGLDLQAAAHSGYAAVDKDFYLSAPIRIVSDVVVLIGAGAPVDGTTGDNIAGKGSLYVDTTNGVLYINTGTITDSTWVKVGTQT